MTFRITVRLGESGRLKFALQQREDDEWGERQLPRSRFLPASPAVGWWLSSSTLTFTAPQEIAEPAEVEQVSEVPPESEPVCRISDHSDRIAVATFQVQTGTSTGTAFYIGQDEWLTNHHVVDGVSQVLLVRAEYSITATVFGSLPGFDLALLRAPAPFSVVPLKLTSIQLPLGSNVSVLGFPHSVSGTPSLTRGVVSKHSSFSEFPGFTGIGSMVQIDAPINPGNNGGPLVNDCGEVVGIATLKFFTTASGLPVEGIGYGISSETIMAQISALRTTVHVETRSVQNTEPDMERIQFGVEITQRSASNDARYSHKADSHGTWVTSLYLIDKSNDPFYTKSVLVITCVHDPDGEEFYIRASPHTRGANHRAAPLDDNANPGFLIRRNGKAASEVIGGFVALDQVVVRNDAARILWANARHTDEFATALPTQFGRTIVALFRMEEALDSPVKHLIERCLPE